MKKYKNHDFTWAFLASAFIAIIMVIISSFSEYESVLFSSQDLYDYNSGWIVNGEEVNLPYYYHFDNENKSIILENNLPQRLSDNTNLVFFSYFSNVDVYIENKPVYSFGNEADYLFTDNPGFSYIIIPIEKPNEGKSIRIELSYNFIADNVKIPNMNLGTSGPIFHMIIVSSAFTAISAALIFIISVYFIFQALIVFKKVRNARSLIYLGLTGILFSVPAAIMTQLWQFFIPNSLAMYFLVDFCLLVLPASFVLYFKNTFSFFNKNLCTLILLMTLLNAAATSILEITGLIPVANSTIVTHSIFILTLIFIYYTFIKERKKTDTVTRHGILLFITTILIDTLRSIFEPGSNVFISIFGMVIFLFFVGKKNLDVFSQELEEAKKYKDIAYHDTLTGAYTLMALNENINKINNSDKYGVAIFDLNSLKYYNDKFGHSVGDYMLTTAVKILNQAFEKFKYVYRIGGDEFLVVLPDATESDFKKAMDTLLFLETQASSMKVMKGESINIEFAYGFALCEKGESFDSVRKKADEFMYSKKNELKK